jgi:hypothetical protein
VKRLRLVTHNLQNEPYPDLKHEVFGRMQRLTIYETEHLLLKLTFQGQTTQYQDDPGFACHIDLNTRMSLP